MCELTQPWEEPKKDIDRRIKANPDLFPVGIIDDRVVATVMRRRDENRDWVEYLAIHLLFRRKGIGCQLVKTSEEKLSAQECSKMCLLIQQESPMATDFCHKVGYFAKSITHMEKILKEDL